jgi:asparagine synthase (glutamine-hydrolysing)
LRLRADVSVAAYLSGGLDSSAIAALAQRVGTGGLQCFGIGFEDAHFDESDHQRRLAAELGIELTQTTVSGADIAAQFPDVVRLGEKPILRTAPAPLLKLSRLARDRGFRVVLTGEGADEVFAGYTTFTEAQIRRFWARNPASSWRPALLDRLYPWLVQDLGRAPQFTRQFFSAGLSDVDDVLYSHHIRFATTSRALRLLNTETRTSAIGDDAPIERLRRQLPAHLEKSTGLGRAQYVEIATFLSGYLLHSQGDRMLMGNSVEGRFPFLDHRVGEFAAALPDNVRLAGLKEKYLLRRAVSRVLPAEVAARPKRPFRAPIHRSFFGPGAPEWVQEVLRPESIRASGLFEPATVERLRRKCTNSLDRGLSEGDEMALVGVLSTQLLHRQFVAGPALAAPAVASRAVIDGKVVTEEVR